MKNKVLIIMLMLNLVVNTQVYAGISENVVDEHYGVRAPARFVQGVTNLLFSWTELLSEPVRSVQKGENFFNGVSKGIGHTVSYCVLGAADLMTFWVPTSFGQDLAIPANVFNCSLFQDQNAKGVMS